MTVLYDPDPKATKAHAAARRRASWQQLRHKLSGGCNDLLPASQVLDSLSLDAHTNLGLRDVPLDRIVGSSGRAQDFDLRFRPLGQDRKERWVRVASGRYQGRDLPPVLLLKVGDAYFVEDGNHRVSVAHALGEATIRAEVIELDPSPLTPKHTCTRLGYKI